MSEQQKKEIDNLIDAAKWNMYGEDWDSAKQLLNRAKDQAIGIKDKPRIDTILELVKKANAKVKVPI